MYMTNLIYNKFQIKVSKVLINANNVYDKF